MDISPANPNLTEFPFRISKEKKPLGDFLIDNTLMALSFYVGDVFLNIMPGLLPESHIFFFRCLNQ
ncbi:MAG: hypothetical protein CM1200mP18_06040 [Gammaproteobacteria bacterium]|nr:MAG: hypothetical protein CM1200mP18_06040 [Gammaproteobacteria bacterium]